MIEYNEGEFGYALIDAKAAYSLRPVPALLYDLGQIHRALHHWEEAAFSFRAYLRQLPDAPNRATVEDLISLMEKKLAEAPPPPLFVPPLPSTPQTSPAPTPRLVVLDVQARLGVSADLAKALTDPLLLEVHRHNPGDAIVGTEEVRAMIGLEKEVALLGCTDTSCLTELGGALGARQLVMGGLSRLGTAYLLTLKLVDMHGGRIVAEASATVEAGRDEALLDLIPKAASQLFQVNSAPAPVARAEPAPAAAVVAVPVAPVASAETEKHGHALAWSMLGTGLAAGVVALVGLGEVLDYYSINSTFQSNPTATNLKSAQLAANRAGPWGSTAIACGVGAALLGVGTALAW